MAVFVVQESMSVKQACADLAAALRRLREQPAEHVMWQRFVDGDDLAGLLLCVRGAERVFFKSRDNNFEMVGFGAADTVSSSESSTAHLDVLVAKAKSLFDDQVYVGGMRFDEAAEVGFEWRDFGKKLFILPCVTIIKQHGVAKLSLNFRADSPLPWAHFCDRALTIMHALMNHDDDARPSPLPHYGAHNYLPGREHYALTMQRAFDAFFDNSSHRKVVVGRRKCLELDDNVDSAVIFAALKQKTRHAFLFFVDVGSGSAFFGVSPELLYRRSGNTIETESLAGTRARACDEAMDDSLRADLLDSLKDKEEHALVSLHIEERLKDFGTTQMSASKLEIMALTFVQHLLRRYRGVINDTVDDAAILPALHPTPAVCGLDIEWARAFIREHEGFDRGFYAGPIGYIANDRAEFAVAIRSALFDQQKLYVYAASGIVPGSLHNQEWEELNNKEKSVLCIFDRT